LIDTGVTVAKDSSLGFAPDGDLYAVERRDGSTDAAVIQFSRTDDGRLVRMATITGPITGECGFAIEPTFVGCPSGTGPQMLFQPPIQLDQVNGDPLLAGVDGRGAVQRIGSIQKRWTVSLDVATPINCDDDTCASLWRPGPSGTALYLPYLETPEGGNHIALFVVGEQPTSDGVRLESMDAVLGLVRTRLYGVQYTATGARLVVFDLAALLP